MKKQIKNSRLIILLIFSILMLIDLNGSDYASASESEVSTDELILKVSNDVKASTDWKISTPEAQGMDTEELTQMTNKIQTSDIGIDSIAIAINGFLVFEKSYGYYEYSNFHNLFSATKSITSILVGIANETGYITNLDQQILDIFSEYSFANMDSRKQHITIRHLLKMESGIEWNEDPIINDSVDKHNYSLLSNNTNYLFEGWPLCMESKSVRMVTTSNDWIQYVLDQPMDAEPGSKFEYSSGVSQLLSAIIQRKTGKTMEDFAKEVLFDPLNLTDYCWWSDPTGITTGAYGLWLTTLDMLKIGQLFLNDGVWNNSQIISKEWIKESTTPNKLGLTMAGMDWYYGYQWWIDKAANSWHAGGFGGQFIFIKPDANLTVAITASEHGTEGPVADLYYSYILTSIDLPNQQNTGFNCVEMVFGILLLAVIARKQYPLK